MTVKSIGGVILGTVVLLLLIEAISYTLVDDTPFLWDTSSVSSAVPSPLFGFDQIDPLLGYGKTRQKLEKQGYKVEKGCIVLSDEGDSAGQVNILITGGSTSDISLDSNC